MPYPSVRFNLDTGSDLYSASGAGPATAISGTQARNREPVAADRWGFWETSPPDLSGVATDGSAVLVVNTPSGRQFSRILAVKDTNQATTGYASASTVSSMGSVEGLTVGDVIKIVGAGPAGADLFTTIGLVGSDYIYINDNVTTSMTTDVVCPRQVRVEQSFSGVSADKGWAIGGKLRDPVGPAIQVFADLGPGWTIILERPESGSPYDFAGEVVSLSVSGDLAAGPVSILGEGRPTLKSFIADHLFSLTAAYYRIGDFEVQDCDEAILVDTATPADCTFQGISSSGEGLTDIIEFTATATGARFRVTGCDFRNYSGAAVKVLGALGGLEVEDTFFVSSGGNGIDAQAGIAFLRVRESIFAGGNYGILLGNGTPAILDIERNVFDSVGNAFYLGGAIDGARGLILRNNIFSNCSGTAITLPTGSDLVVGVVDFNDFWGNAVNRSGISAGPNDVALDPQYRDAAAYDFRPGLALRAIGWPAGAYGASALTPTAQDMGSAQAGASVGGNILARIAFLNDAGEDWELGVVQVGGTDDGLGRMVHVPKALIPAAGELAETALIYQVATALRDQAAAALVGKEVQV